MSNDRPIAALAIRTLDGAIRVGLLALLLLAGLPPTPAQAQTVDLDTTFEQYKVTLDHDLHRVTGDAVDSRCGLDTQTNPLCGLEEFYRCLMTPAGMNCGTANFMFRQQATGADVASEDFAWQLQAAEFALQAFEHPNLNLVLIKVRERLCWGDRSARLWQPDWRLAHYILWWTKNQRWEVVASIPPLPLMRNRSQALSTLSVAAEPSIACGEAP
jgi:hypothetical protein